MHTARVLRPLLAGVCVAGGLAAGSGLPARAATSCTSAAVQRRVASAVGIARSRYELERNGVAVHAALGVIAADRILTDALRAGNLVAGRTEAVRQVAGGHQHVSAIRVVRGNRVLVETTVYPFDVAGAQSPLRDRRGAILGTLQVTIQDVIGFIRLVHKFAASQVVVQGSRGEVKSSLPALLTVHLPTTGCATAAGRTYAVRSFGETGFAGEPLTIWILKAA